MHLMDSSRAGGHLHLSIHYSAQVAGKPIDDNLWHGGAMANDCLVRHGFEVLLKDTGTPIPLGYRWSFKNKSLR